MSREISTVSQGLESLKTPENLPGNFRRVFSEVENAVQKELEKRGLVIPEVESDLHGVYRLNGCLRSTTSTVARIEDGIGFVLKVLREPNNRHPDKKNSGPIWDDFRGHELFAWSGADGHDIETGICIQEDCLRGELSRGVLYNPCTSPYLGIVGARQLASGEIEVLPRSEISAKKLIFPGLLMREAKMDFMVSKILQSWTIDQRTGGEKTWPELTAEDMARLLAESVIAFDNARVAAPQNIIEEYGTVDFFRRCLTLETPLLAAQMGEWYPHNPQIVNASKHAQKIVDAFKIIIEEQPRLFELAGESIVIGHADSKPSNSAICAQDREEVIAMAKGEAEPRFVQLDAQSLAVKPGILSPDGVDYAHWPIVPRTQQWAYGLKMSLGLGLGSVHDRAFELVRERTGVGWGKEEEALYRIWIAYKMGGVEPFVNAQNYDAMASEDGSSYASDETRRHLTLLMESYPAEAVRHARKAMQIAGSL